MKNQKKLLATLFVSILSISAIAILIFFIQNRNFYITDASPCTTASASLASTLTEIEVNTAEEINFNEYDFSLMALGDNLIHMGIVSTGRQSDGTYNYDFLFQNIDEFLDVANVKVINQETILGGNQLGFSGFPRFNSPSEVGDAIANAGFNVVLHASNHTGDKGLTGLNNCLSFWGKNYPDILVAGVTDNETSEIPFLTVGHTTIAILNYTYGPNAETIPSELRGQLNMLCAYNKSSGLIDFKTLNPQVLEDISYADEIADIVIVFPHWGTEYQTKPSSYQEKFAEQMTEAGADIIIGTHPHVVQPVETITADNGNTSLCYYSLGNYVSTQKQTISMLEGMAWVTFHVTEDDISIVEEKTGVLPLVCHYTAMPVRFENVYLLEEYTEEQAAAHGIRNYGGVVLHLDELQENSNEIFGDMILKKSDILE